MSLELRPVSQGTLVPTSGSLQPGLANMMSVTLQAGDDNQILLNQTIENTVALVDQQDQTIRSMATRILQLEKALADSETREHAQKSVSDTLIKALEETVQAKDAAIADLRNTLTSENGRLKGHIKAYNKYWEEQQNAAYNLSLYNDAAVAIRDHYRRIIVNRPKVDPDA